MNKPRIALLPLAAAGLFLAAGAGAQDNVTNRLSLSARFGFNISASFKGLNSLPAPPNVRTTPRGDGYNYDDGYVLTDTSGNAGGQTWYWGYDNSSKQIGNNAILLSQTALGGKSPDVSAQDNPSLGVELVYQRLLWTPENSNVRVGVELAGNYQNLGISDSRTITADAVRTTYPFAFTPGTTPPLASPGMPYQGSYEGPGFVINYKPGDPSAAVVPGGASINGHRQYDADIWGFRLGPYVQLPIGERFDVSLSLGLAGAVVNSDVNWHESLTINGATGATVSGAGHSDDLLWGFYVGANAAWRFSDRWSAVAGVQYQDLGDLSNSYGGREVVLNLHETIFVTVGLAWSF
jgi:hypothetical protein